MSLSLSLPLSLSLSMYIYIEVDVFTYVYIYVYIYVYVWFEGLVFKRTQWKKRGRLNGLLSDIGDHRGCNVGRPEEWRKSTS